MKSLIIFVILISTIYCSGQSLSDNTTISRPTHQIVKKIEKINILMGSAVYYEGMRPAQYDHFARLRKTATQKELIALTSYPNGVVRCYAFWALSYHSSAKFFPILLAHITDTTSVRTQFGCIGGSEKVGDFFIHLVTPDYIDMDAKKLTQAEYDYLDSVLIYQPNNLYAKNNAIGRARLDETLYKRLRELVLGENNQPALILLAKFKQQQDIQLILDSRLHGDRYNPLFFTYRAISEFPDSAFLPLLTKSLHEVVGEKSYSSEINELYKAIASFKNDTALQLLKWPFTHIKHENIKTSHMDFILGALQTFYIPAYNELLWQLWENEKKINAEVFNILYRNDSEKAFRLTKMTLENAANFFYPNYQSYDAEEVTTNILNIMLDTVITRDKPYAIVLINKNLKEADVHQFPIFAHKAFTVRDTSFIKILFGRLRIEENPHTYLKATEFLVALKDKEINRQISGVIKFNPELKKGWGGEAFTKLLKENGIRK